MRITFCLRLGRFAANQELASMFACLFVPDFPVEAFVCLEPELRVQPVAVLEGKPPLSRIIAMNDRARAAALELGMTRMQAQLRAPEAVLRMRSPEQEATAHASLLDCGHAFSPRVEDTALDHIVIDVSGLDRLLGNLSHVAEQIAQRTANLGLQANVAAASNPDAAVYAAHGFSGTTIIPAGAEAERLGTLPIENLFPPPETMETLYRWGVRTFTQLAALPEVALSQRLGQEGLQIQKLARGTFVRTLIPAEAPLAFQEAMELEYPIDLLEPLAFVLSRLLEHICTRLESRSLATNALHLWLQLEQEDAEHGPDIFERDLRLPVPMLNPKLFLQLLHLDLKAHPPPAPISKVRLTADPVRPRLAQGGLFLPVAPEAERLELTLARAQGVVGEERVGVAKVLDTHRRDPFRMERFEVTVPANKEPVAKQSGRVVKRIFRPPVSVVVLVNNRCPVRLQPHGEVLACSGPWHSSGEWWSDQAWQHEEWDVAVREKEDVALYRIYRDLSNGRWFLAASYD
jgi:protein ImuB